jgi:hypothetical protein
VIFALTILLPGLQSPKKPEGFIVYARSGWQIPTEQPPTRSLKQMKIARDELQYWQRNRIEVRSLSPYPYNCVGMIFASRRAWLEIDYIYDILREDGYHKIEQHEVMVGDVVLYKDEGDPSHVALVVAVERLGQTVNVRVISKWGLDPEFLHFQEDVTVRLGIPVEYYTDRVNVPRE